jgi:hypothetical protein
MRSSLCWSRFPPIGIADADVQEWLYRMIFRVGRGTANAASSRNARDLAKAVAAREPGDADVRRVDMRFGDVWTSGHRSNPA